MVKGQGSNLSPTRKIREPRSANNKQQTKQKGGKDAGNEKGNWSTMSALSRAQKTKGENFINQALSTLNKKTWFASSTEQKYEDAAELYEQAANAYKVGSLFKEAGEAYEKAAELHRDKLKNIGEASKCLSNAGK